MPFLSTLGAVVLLGFGFCRLAARLAVYFFNDNNNNLWSNANSWYAEEAHTTPTDFPATDQTAYVLSDTEIVLDGIVDDSNNYTSWQALDYWAPPAAITGIGTVDIKIISYKFSDAPDPIPVFTPNNASYDTGAIVEYPTSSKIYYEAKQPANNTSLVSGVPDPTYWGYIGPQPYLPTSLTITTTGDVEIESVNIAPPA